MMMNMIMMVIKSRGEEDDLLEPMSLYWDIVVFLINWEIMVL